MALDLCRQFIALCEEEKSSFRLSSSLSFVNVIFPGDSAELWVTLNAMGYNHTLVQDEVAMFEVTGHF